MPRPLGPSVRVVAAALSACALLACQSPAEKTAQMCNDMKQVVDANRDDCEKMATELRAWFDKYKDERAFGSPDAEEMAKAQQPCNEAATTLAASCAGNQNVMNVLKDMQTHAQQ